jgi:hypothetical protein
MEFTVNEKTFAYQEKQLLNQGYKCELLHHRASCFKKDNQVAMIFYIGSGQGFETVIYDVIAEA